MTSFLNAFLLSYATLFPIVNPVGNAPLFASLTQSYAGPVKVALARRIALNSFLLLLASFFAGSYVLEFFGISLSIVRIAGGLVVTAFAWRLLHADSLLDMDHGAIEEFPPSPDAFFPLTMPLTVGPGSISVAITLGSQRTASATVLAMLGIACTIYTCYRFAHIIMEKLGLAGTKTVVRLAAFLMLCIGFQITWNGWLALTAKH